ncbi:Golgi to ER traffic protein 4 homolog [Octopus bimaculoides]|nr:Golgi to ER traffic protein 4 homolog [Octopus bimaculoides]
MCAERLSRILAKCQACVDANNFYEAHQMYRTLYFRYNAQHKYEDALELLYKGSVTLLQHRQQTSGTDLASLFINTLTSSSSPVLEDPVIRKHDIQASLFFLPQSPATIQMGSSQDFRVCDFVTFTEKNYEQARYHFLHSTDGANTAALLIEYHVSRGFPSEVDLFIAQAVLQFLCLQNKDTANVVFLKYTKEHPHLKKGPPFLMPLLNFIWFLLLALDTGKVSLFTILCEKYETSINRDPTYKEYLDRIGQLFFGLPPPKQSPHGILGNLLQSLFGAEDDREQDSAMGSSTEVTAEELD